MITQLKEKKNIIFLIVNLALLLLGLLYLRDTVSPYKTIFLVSYISVFIGIILLVLFQVRTKVIMSLMLLLFSAAFFLATPNGSMHDEEAHFYRAFQISGGISYHPTLMVLAEICFLKVFLTLMTIPLYWAILIRNRYCFPRQQYTHRRHIFLRQLRSASPDCLPVTFR